jgi:hypothetical protein
MQRERLSKLNTPMDNITLHAWIGKAVYAVGIAALLGGSNMIVGNSKDVAVLQSQQAHSDEQLSRMEGKIDRLVERLAQ